MVLTRINNLVVIFIILCSTSFYKFKVLGPIDKIAELIGVGVIIFSLILYLVYSKGMTIPKRFTTPIILIIISIFTSTFMASYGRNQGLGATIFAQRALYYYLLYFLLHQMKIKPKDLEMIFFGLGIFYVVLYLMQYILYPTILFDTYIRETRGTVRMYLAGSDYMAISMFISVQKFIRRNQFKYFFLAILFFSIFILMGGRQVMAIMIFTMVLFVIIDRKVKSRMFLVFLGSIGALALFMIFRDIFTELVVQSQRDLGHGENYIRFRAAQFFLTDFMANPLAYLFGNGSFYTNSDYGRELGYYGRNYGYFVGDVGLVGNYVLYGAFFMLGVIGILIRVFKIKIEEQYIYIKYFYGFFVFAVITSTGFAQTDTICYLVLLLYMIDVSGNNLVADSNLTSEKLNSSIA